MSNLPYAIVVTLLATLACAAVADDQRWHRAVVSLTACGEGYVLVKPALPPAPNVMYIQSPPATCVRAGDLLGKLSPGDVVVISGSAGNYQIIGKD